MTPARYDSPIFWAVQNITSPPRTRDTIHKSLFWPAIKCCCFRPPDLLATDCKEGAHPKNLRVADIWPAIWPRIFRGIISLPQGAGDWIQTLTQCQASAPAPTSHAQLPSFVDGKSAVALVVGAHIPATIIINPWPGNVVSFGTHLSHREYLQRWNVVDCRCLFGHSPNLWDKWRQTLHLQPLVYPVWIQQDRH